MVSGRMRLTTDDGTEGEAGAGAVVWIAPGHDARLVGDETCVFIDFSGFETYARES